MPKDSSSRGISTRNNHLKQQTAQVFSQNFTVSRDQLFRQNRRWELDPPVKKGLFPVVEAIRSVVPNVRQESGQTMAEYAVVLAVITIAVVAVLTLLSTAIKTKLNAVISSL
jgi:Flp pilus assembly pilin Flp